MTADGSNKERSLKICTTLFPACRISFTYSAEALLSVALSHCSRDAGQPAFLDIYRLRHGSEEVSGN